MERSIERERERGDRLSVYERVRMIYCVCGSLINGSYGEIKI